MNPRFESSRSDGLTASQVLCKLVESAPAGHLFTHQDLAKALGENSEKSYTVEDVRGVVSRCYAAVLRETQRALQNVRGVGYRIAPASEQRQIAKVKKKRSDRQLRLAVKTLQHVRWDEMDPNARAAHEGQLIILNALASNQLAMEQRLSRTEEAVRTLMQRSEAKALPITAG